MVSVNPRMETFSSIKMLIYFYRNIFDIMHIGLAQSDTSRKNTQYMRSFVKIKSSRLREITLLFTDISKSRPYCEFLTLQICVLTLFAKIKFCEHFRIYSTYREHRKTGLELLLEKL